MKRSLGPFLLLAFILIFSRPPRQPSLQPRRSGPARPAFIMPEGLSDFTGGPGVPADPDSSVDPPGALPLQDAGGFSLEPSPKVVHVEVEERLFLQASLKWLLARQNPDGSWGMGWAFLEGHWMGKVGETSLGLLAFLGEGFSHLSKDRYDGQEIGSVVRLAAQWLMQDMGPGSMFRSAREGTLEQALGALALGEIFGMTGSNLFKEKAQDALSALRGFQIEDGSFGDAMTTDWALAAIQSARMGGLELWEGGLDRLRPAYEKRELAAPDAGTALFRIWIDGAKEEDRVRRAAEAIFSRPAAPWAGSAYERYRNALALLQIEGPAGPLWKGWNPILRDTLQLMEAGRLWEGSPGNASVVDAALTALSRQVYYRHSPCPFSMAADRPADSDTSREVPEK